MAYRNAILLILEAAIYFAMMLAILRASKRIGIGVFITVLGVMHFLETYLASVFYIGLPFGVVASPGSALLFSSKLILILLVYITEDADTARQPIYGLFIGNAVVILFAGSLALYGTADLSPNRSPDLKLLDEMGLLMGWGTALLFIDAILIILLYEKLRTWLGDNRTARILVSSTAILTFDQLGFFAGLRFLIMAPVDVLWSGWIAKMTMALLFSPMAGAYLSWVARQPLGRPKRRLWDVFGALTYRERYEDLLENIGRDRLTGVFDRGYFEAKGASIVAQAIEDDRPISLLLIDLDNFKNINDQFGHRAGDAALRFAAHQIGTLTRDIDYLFRYGGDEFVLLCSGLPPGGVQAMAERIRRHVSEVVVPETGRHISVSIGTASGGINGDTLEALFEVADKRLYAAKRAGRNRVFDGEALSPGHEDAAVAS
ncbi:GGDEF domain-containing protein [Microvirga flavescens]|uniref:GGDEF domain-containing protein n=1 Tax=Microvirga flavescens TaxID=2249811 RepID=UPI000DDAB702|nr:GGDEF domain-containing protein [Microvirga flavescens]